MHTWPDQFLEGTGIGAAAADTKGARFKPCEPDGHFTANLREVVGPVDHAKPLVSLDNGADRSRSVRVDHN
jgi:hypothetical protein